jgi:putative ABC transport system ATP-binding protein
LKQILTRKKKKMKLTPALLATLQKLPVFREFSPTQLMKLFRICQQETYEKGESLCRAGTESDRMYILLSGTVSVHTDSRLFIAKEIAPTTIGEVGLLTGELRAASVMTESTVKALVVYKRSLQKLIQDDPLFGLRLYHKIMVILREKLLIADQRIEELSGELMKDSDTPPPVVV